RGYAYGANIGWINLDDLNIYVQTNTIDPGADTDSDGLPDAWELSYFGTLARNGSGDPDSDGEDNLSEFRAGTNPTDGTSVFRSGRVLNISTRLQVLTGDDVLIGGFIISGDTSKKVIIRGLGPSLVAQGVSGALPDPKLELFDSGGDRVAVNNNWKETQQNTIEATMIPPPHDRDSALVRTLAPGAYTTVLTGVANTTGIGLVEVYDLTANEPVRLANISTRGFVDTGENVMIGGFIVGGGLGTNGSGSARFLVRGLGPSLADVGVDGPLSNPLLQIYNGNGDSVAINDDWRETQRLEIEATGIPPKNIREAAFVGTFGAGGYTAVLRGVDNGTGVGLVEIYNLP
ncbi:MAG: hypothetical protein H0T11_09290, partial [Chthoniobacterales bacterium]|nr:hypothetical protein [Chthoniobacterales bacterium]